MTPPATATSTSSVSSASRASNRSRSTLGTRAFATRTTILRRPVRARSMAVGGLGFGGAFNIAAARPAPHVSTAKPAWVIALGDVRTIHRTFRCDGHQPADQIGVRDSNPGKPAYRATHRPQAVIGCHALHLEHGAAHENPGCVGHHGSSSGSGRLSNGQVTDGTRTPAGARVGYEGTWLHHRLPGIGRLRDGGCRNLLVPPR